MVNQHNLSNGLRIRAWSRQCDCTVPRSLQSEFGLKAYDKLMIKQIRDGIVIIPVRESLKNSKQSAIKDSHLLAKIPVKTHEMLFHGRCSPLPTISLFSY